MDIQIRKMSLKPGDVLVVKVKALLSDCVKEAIQKEIKELVSDVPVLVADGMTELGIIAMSDTTRFIEKDMNGSGDMAWECEQCEDARQFEEFHPSVCDFNYCPKCGRKIIEFVGYVEPGEEE